MSQIRDLSILNAIAEALNSAPDVEQALTRTLGLVAELLGLQTGWVWLVNPDSRQFYSAAVRNLPPFLQRPVQMIGDDTCDCMYEFRQGTLTPKNIDVMECSRLRRAVRAKLEAETQGLRYHASIPLSFQDKPLGIMNVTGPSWRKLTARELRLLSTIAYQVSIAIERARLAEEGTRLARAEERTRLAREIHDTLAQGLTAIALHVEGALRHLEHSPELARERLQRALETTRESLEEARRSVLNLRAPPLAGKPLAEALGALARSFTAETGVRVHLHVQGQRGLRALPLRTEAELFHIAQEALTNVRKHAGATEVDITLRATAGRVRLTIHDNGQGFTPRGTPRAADQGSGGHGILGMRERARLLGGTLRLASAPG
ncbi:MAG TPA: GAF domain-containing sensor histidine kinase, partial [Chloroflexota bacterium]|nr:GAF domain-containing sensor histidine kinase [Chloroflexota bacterium]